MNPSASKIEPITCVFLEKINKSEVFIVNNIKNIERAKIAQSMWGGGGLNRQGHIPAKARWPIIELNRIELNWTELDWIEWDWNSIQFDSFEIRIGFQINSDELS